MVRGLPPSATGPGTTGDGAVKADGPEKLDGCFTRLNDEGYRQQPRLPAGENFWPLQWAELALFLAVSGLVAGFCLWWVRRLA